MSRRRPARSSGPSTRRPATTLTIVLDARIEPGIFGREEGATTVVGGRREVTLEYTTWVAP